MTATAPTNPHSSEITEKMKSVCCWGRKFRPLWVPWRKPLPARPPEPIAIFDWLMW